MRVRHLQLVAAIEQCCRPFSRIGAPRFKLALMIAIQRLLRRFLDDFFFRVSTPRRAETLAKSVHVYPAESNLEIKTRQTVERRAWIIDPAAAQ